LELGMWNFVCNIRICSCQSHFNNFPYASAIVLSWSW